jgi:hypothetical protein
MSESGSPKHAIVLRELDQLLTSAAGNGVSVQISIKAIERISNVLIDVKLKFVRLTVVAVKEQFVLNILNVCL